MKNYLFKEYFKNIKIILLVYLIYLYFFVININLFYEKGKFSCYYYYKVKDIYLKL